MASIKIHSDLYNFKRTIKGFTTRQIKAFVGAIAGAAGMVVLLWYVIGVHYIIALSVGVFGIAMPAIAVGVFPVGEVFFGLPAEEMIQKTQDLGARGNTLSWRGESIEPLKGETSRAYKKKAKRKGAECIG